MKATHVGDSQSEADVIHRGKRVGVCHGGCDWGSRGLRRGAIARGGEAVGGCQSDAALAGAGGDLRWRDWVLAFNAEGPLGLVNGKAPGNAPLLTQAHRQALLEIVESGPIPAVHGVVRWRLIDLAQWVFDEFRISISKQTLSRERKSTRLNSSHLVISYA